MNALHGPHSCLHMRRLGAHLNYIKNLQNKLTAAASVASSHRLLSGSVVPPVCSTLGLRTPTAASALLKMSEGSPVAKKARLDPGVAAAAGPPEPPAAVPSSLTASPAAYNVTTTADSSQTSPTSSRRRIRHSRSPSPKKLQLQQQVRHASSDATAAASAAKQETSTPVAEAAAADVTANGVELSAAVSLQGDVQHTPGSPQQGVAAEVAAEEDAAVPNGHTPSNGHAAEDVAAQHHHQQPLQQQHHQQQLQPQQQKQQQQQSPQPQKQSKKNKKQSSPVFQLTMGIHQCIKMDMPHEAFYLYQKIKTVDPEHKMDTAIVSALLNLIVGKWRWELQQRHQHLVREYASSSQDTAELDAAYEACVAAALQEKQQQQQDSEGQDLYARIVGVHPPGTPEELICHVEKQIELRDDTKLHLDMVAALLSDMDSDHKLSMQQLTESAVAVALDDLKTNGQTWDEQIYLQLARISAITGDIDKAHDYAMQLVSAWQSNNKSNKLIPRLRDFQPALVGYALTGQADKATELINVMTTTCELDLTEPEFGLWLEAIARGGTYDQLTAALKAVAGELNKLRTNTVDMIARFFKSNPAAAAAEPLAALGKQQWQQQRVLPDPEGYVREADVKLQLADLSSEDWEAFGEQVRSLAVQQEKKQGSIEEFVSWLRRNGPYDIMIDGANVALWGENYEGGGFKAEKIKVMYDTVVAENPDAKVLLVLHAGRLYDIKRNHAEMSEWLQQLYSQKKFYTAPAGSNDDWYWMYATVMAREKGSLVSNDLLRDHVWNLLRPKHMLKWTQRHIIRFSFNFEKTETYLKYPLPYTPCVQYDAEKGVWMVPCEDKEGQWLCVRPV